MPEVEKIPEVLEVCGIKFRGQRIFIEAGSDEIESQASMFNLRDLLIEICRDHSSVFSPAYREPKPKRVGVIEVK